MDGKYRFALGATALIVFCVTVIVVIVYVSLWQYHEAVTWGLLALVALAALVWLVRSINEISLRRSRFNPQHETPLTRSGYPTHLQKGQRPYYPPYYAQDHTGAQPHDQGEYAHFHSE